jgi:hypothetical protein
MEFIFRYGAWHVSLRPQGGKGCWQLEKSGRPKLSSRFPVPSCKIAFLFGKAQDLQEELSFFTIQFVV